MNFEYPKPGAKHFLDTGGHPLTPSVTGKAVLNLMTKIQETRYKRIHKSLGPGNYKRIGRDVEVSPQHVSRFLRGLKGATFGMATRIAEAGEVTLDDLHWFIEMNIEAKNAA